MNVEEILDIVLKFLYYVVNPAIFIIVRTILYPETALKLLFQRLFLYYSFIFFGANMITFKFNNIPFYLLMLSEFIIIIPAFSSFKIIHPEIANKRQRRIANFHDFSQLMLIYISTIAIAVCKNIRADVGVVTFAKFQQFFTVVDSQGKMNFMQVKDLFLEFFKKYLIIPVTIALIITIIYFFFLPAQMNLFDDFIHFPIKISINYITIIYVVIAAIMIYNIYEPERSSNSSFFKDNYILSKPENIIFPEKKKNIILIVMESFESTFMSTKNGGLYDETLIPNLEKMALDKENIQFSDRKDMPGGGYSFDRISYTAASSYSMLCADVIGTPLYITKGVNIKTFRPHLTCLGDVTKAHGYINTAILPTTKYSCNQGYVFRSHGFDSDGIADSYEINNTDEWVKDYITLDYAKKHLQKISKQGKPFFNIIMTLDTHPPGFLCHLCDKSDKRKQLIAISCVDRQMKGFLDWLKTQDFYNDTVVILQGDHPVMFYPLNGLAEEKGYTRRTFNLILNSKTVPKNRYNRKHSVMDLFPTILASIGAEIKGERLGLGVNLFSNEKTLLDKYSYKYINDELSAENDWYLEHILFETPLSQLRVTVTDAKYFETPEL